MTGKVTAAIGMLSSRIPGARARTGIDWDNMPAFGPSVKVRGKRGRQPGRAPKAREPGPMYPYGAGKHAESHPHQWDTWFPDQLASASFPGMTDECGARPG